MIENGLNRYTLHSELMFVILKFLPIPDLKYLVISTAEELKPAVDRKLRTAEGSSNRYYAGDRLNNLTEMIFHCYAHLDEYENGIEYFNQHHKESDPEIKLYMLVQLLFRHYRRADLNIEQINKAQAQGVCPRKGLIELGQHITANNRLQKYLP